MAASVVVPAREIIVLCARDGDAVRPVSVARGAVVVPVRERTICAREASRVATRDCVGLVRDWTFEAVRATTDFCGCCATEPRFLSFTTLPVRADSG